MKREAVQEERQRGAKMLPKQTEDLNQANPVRDLTIERLMEAEQKSEARVGDSAIPYLRVGTSSLVPTEYKVLYRLYQLKCIALHCEMLKSIYNFI